MKKKERFSPWNGVLNVAMAMVSIMYFSIGFFGYLKYGHDSAASVTLNLPVSDVLCQIVKILFSIGIFISYNLQFYVAADIIWSFMVRSIKYLKSLNESPEFETESVNKDVKKSEEPEKWLEAMKTEMKSHSDNKSFEYVERWISSSCSLQWF